MINKVYLIYLFIYFSRDSGSGEIERERVGREREREVGEREREGGERERERE
jgi:hypothetical protein